MFYSLYIVMTTVFPVASINDAISKAAASGVDTSVTGPFLTNVSYIEQNPTPYIYNAIVKQNIQISRKLIDIHTVNTTEDKKAFYQSEQNRNVEKAYDFLYWAYYGFAVIFLLMVYKYYVSNPLWFSIITVAVAFFPYWMIYVERFLLILYRFIAALLFGIPFALPRQLYVFQTPDGKNIRF